MLVLGGSASNGLDIALSKELGADLVKIQTVRFPDGEIKVRVPEDIKKDDEIIIVQSTYWPQEKNMFELLFTAYELKQRKANVCAVIPYLAYARQNMSFTPGEAISINAVIDMMGIVGIKSIVTVNPHKHESLDHFKGKTCIANAATTMAKGINGKINDPFVLAPDKSALVIAKPIADELGCEYSYIDKARDQYGNVTIKKAHAANFKDKDVIICDDMISAGSTIEQASRFAYGEGAGSVSAACVHLVMVKGAYERLKGAGVTKIFGSNTIPFEDAEKIDISPDLAKCVKNIYSK